MALKLVELGTDVNCKDSVGGEQRLACLKLAVCCKVVELGTRARTATARTRWEVRRLACLKLAVCCKVVELGTGGNCKGLDSVGGEQRLAGWFELAAWYGNQ